MEGLEIVRTTGLGIMQRVAPGEDSIPEYDRRKREHLWTVLTMYRIADPLKAMTSGESQLLDTENLLSVTGIGCYYCEEVWSKTLHHRKCAGPTMEDG